VEKEHSQSPVKFRTQKSVPYSTAEKSIPFEYTGNDIFFFSGYMGNDILL